MSLWLLVPVKPFSEAKSRLASALAPAERTALMRGMLERTLRLAEESHLFAQRLVVSRDDLVWQTARRAGALALPEEGVGLNQALVQGCAWARLGGAKAVLIVPADLPLLSTEDLQGLWLCSEQGADVVLARSQDGGTNAMLLTLPPPMPFAFGPDSLARHKQLAQDAGLRVVVYESTSLAFDVDWPADLERLDASG